MKRVLLFSGAFLPHNETITQIAYKTVCNLDYEIDVVTFRSKPDASFEEYLKKDDRFKKIHIHYVDADWKSLGINSKNLNIIRTYRLIRALWKKGRELVNSNEYEAAFSFTMPTYIHFAAYKAIKKKRIKWYASFSDPISKNLYIEQLKKERLRTKILYVILRLFFHTRRFETVALRNADKLLFISDELRDYITRGDEKCKKKSIIYPITYDKKWPSYKAVIKAGVLDGDNRITFAHFGNIYGLRKIGLFMEALDQLRIEDPTLFKNVEIHQYGDIDKFQMKALNTSRSKDMLVVHDRIGYDQCVKKMKASDILMVFDTIVPDGQIQPFLPSKITDYLLTNKPIFAITPSISPLRSMISEKHVCARYDIKEIKDGIKKLIKKHGLVKNDVDWLDNDRVSLEIFGREFDMIDSIRKGKK